MESKDQEIEKLLDSLKTERQVIIDLRDQAEKERAEVQNLKNKLQAEVQAFREESRQYCGRRGRVCNKLNTACLKRRLNCENISPGQSRG